MSSLATYDPIIESAAQEWNLDPNLIRAVAQTESAGDPKAASKKGAVGLMQLLPETAKAMGATDPTDPAQNIYAGAKYLSQALDAENGNPGAALLYYHGGPGWRQADGPESHAYVPAVAAKYQQFAKQYPMKGAAPAPANDHGSMSDADFLSHTTVHSAPVEDDNAFLARTSGHASPPVNADPSVPTGGVIAGAAPAPVADGTLPGAVGAANSDSPQNRVLNAIEQGAAQGYGSGPLGMGPQTTAALQAAGVYPPAGGGGTLMQGVNKAVINPLAYAADLALRGGGAVMGAGQGLVRQGLAEAGMPLLGRDLAALPEAFPTGFAPELRGAVGPAAPRNMLEPPAPPAPEIAPAPPGTPPGTPPGSPGAAPNVGPSDLGAAASAAEATNMSPEQTQAYRSVAETQKLLEPQPIGRDFNRYVPGVNPTMADLEQSANVSREQKQLESMIPEQAKTISKENNEARQQFFQQIAGSPVDVDNAIQARSAQAQRDLQTAFGSKQPVDATPVAQTIQDILSSPRAIDNSALQKFVAPLAAKLQDGDGLVSDPERLYGLREEVSRMMSKASSAETPTLSHVTGELATIKGALDTTIEQGAPGYQQYLKNYADASRPIDTMQVLQGHEPGLMDSANRMQASRVQSMMKNIVTSRAAPGLNPYKSIPDETVQQLFNLRDDLRRVASSDELAKSKGSDTAQNFMDMAKNAAKFGGELGLHAGANFLAPVAGSMVISAAKKMRQNALQRGMEKRAGNMLRPDYSQYPAPQDGP